ncbi:MAG: LysM peptidoglycan-binding domain-containing protein [Sphingobacteriales bacterium]|nr:MAG: LysM peptidoglycan-binding domain-containing protein [Sphingobacteriales bacterium]
MIHTVLPNESLFSIALQYQISMVDLMEINQLSNGVVVAGQELLIPDSVIGKIRMRSFSNRQTYVVASGDTLWAIATKFNVGVDALKKENNLTSNALQIGQVLQIPDTSSTNNNTTTNNPMTNNVGTQTIVHTVAAGESLWSIAKKYGDTVDEVKSRNKLTTNNLFIGQKLTIANLNGINTGENSNSNSGGQINSDQWYTVKAGDTLNLIAFIFDTTAANLRQLNNLTNDSLRVGQQILVKKATVINPPPVNNNTNNNNPAPTDNNSTQKPIYYIVQAGDGLWGIASRFKILITDLRRWNNLNSDNLSIGQKLIVGFNNAGNDHQNGNDTPVTDPEDEDVEVNIPVNSPLTFKYLIEISDSVGNNAVNLASDVRKVQEQLNRLGFLSSIHFNNERPFNADSQAVNSQFLPQTIAAIRSFQQTVIPQSGVSDGQIKPKHASLMFLNTTVVQPDANKLQQILQARAGFVVEEFSGIPFLQNGLSAPVGATNFGNNPDDVRKIQQRLEQLNLLKPIPAQESPPSGSTDSIPPSKLVKTIEAIKKFQEQRVKFWRNKPAIINSTEFLEGITGKDERDLTFTILRDYTEYRIMLPASALNGNPNVVFRSHFASAYTINTKGISYFGQVSPDKISLQEFQSFGLNASQAKALKFVSEHEGKFDALNTYDKANFSYGFIQFAGGDGGLAPMMGLMKYLYPKTFQTCFQQYGIDVEFSLNEAQGQVSAANLTVVTTEGQLLRRVEAEQYLRDSKLLSAVFVNAAYEKEVQKAQIESAKRKYMVPALNIRINLNLLVIRVMASGSSGVSNIYVGTEAESFKRKSEFSTLKSQGRIVETVLALQNHPIAEIIRSEKGITTLIDSTVNQWVNRTAAYFTSAITAVASVDNLDTLSKLKNINERKVLEHISQNADDRIRLRTANILAETTLSLNKSNA